MEENHELELAWQVIENTGTHLFLTGKAGTGKTTFLRRLKELTPKRMVVVAPTGIAAINAGGVTIHSFFQLNFAPYIPESTFNSAQQSFHRFGKEKINIIRSMDLLVIDEISMVRADQLDAVDAVLRRYRDRSKPFGGVQLLMIDYEHVHFAGNIGKPLCDVVLENNLLEEENHYIVIEMSNFQLLDIDKFRPEISTIINLTPDHLDYMASLDEYYASKMRIYENCESDDEVFVNNIDDETLQEYLQRYHVYCCVLTQSLNKPADCSIIDQAIYFRGEHIIDLKDIKIVGDHNVQNIMIATTICLVAGVSPRVIKDVVSHFKGVEHRIEFVREYNGVRVYNDSKATNTDASIIALKAFKQPVILLMGGFDKGLDLQEMSTYNSCIKKLVTFGAAGKRFKGDMHHQDAYYEKTLKDAVNKAFEISEPGDIILLSPSTSSFDEFKGYEERGRIFKQYVNEK